MKFEIKNVSNVRVVFFIQGVRICLEAKQVKSYEFLDDISKKIKKIQVLQVVSKEVMKEDAPVEDIVKEVHDVVVETVKEAPVVEAPVVEAPVKETTVVEESKDDISTMSHKKLQNLCDAKGLSKKGNKKELRKRLIASL